MKTWLFLSRFPPHNQQSGSVPNNPYNPFSLVISVHLVFLPLNEGIPNNPYNPFFLMPVRLVFLPLNEGVTLLPTTPFPFTCPLNFSTSERGYCTFTYNPFFAYTGSLNFSAFLFLFFVLLEAKQKTIC